MTESKDDRKIIHFSYSGFKKAKECQLQHFLDKNIPWEDEDGDPVRVDDKRNAIMGIVLQKVLEIFINEGHLIKGVGRVWLFENFDRIFLQCIKADRVAWTDIEDGESLDDYFERGKSNPDIDLNAVYKDTLSNLGNFAETIAENKLIARDLRSEVLIKAYIREARVWIYGGVDFVSLSKNLIFDGKGTKHNTRYLDNDQLLWYRIGIRQMPEMNYTDCHRTGFLLIREKKMLWKEFTGADIAKLRSKINTVANGLRLSLRKIKQDLGKEYAHMKPKGDALKGLKIEEDPRVKYFMANPSKSTCRFCPYKELSFRRGVGAKKEDVVYRCPEYMKQKENEALFAEK